MNKFAVAILIICLPVLAGCSGKHLSIDEGIYGAPLESYVSPAVPEEPYQYAAPFDAELYSRLYRNAPAVPEIGDINGAIVPHHLVGGYLPAQLFKYLSKQNPPLVIIFGPNHFNRGNAPIISTLRDWQTPFGAVKTADKLVEKLAGQNFVKIDEEVIKNEHSVNSLVSFVKQSLPDAQLAVFVSPFFTSTGTIDGFAEAIAPLIPDSAVIISSIDFSHYQTRAAAEFHDELSKQSIRNFDYSRLNKLEIDSPPSLYFFLRMMEKRGAKNIAYESGGNSADMMNNPGLEETTSYYSPYFVKGENEPEKIASILNFGDMMLDRNVKALIDAKGADYIFRELAGEENRFFIGMDLIGANLEGPFADTRRATSKEIAFRFDPALLPMLKKFNFGIFSQANNHSYDMGAAGFEESKKNLSAAGIDYYGSQYRVDNESLLVKKIGDYNIGFIGLNDTNSPIDIIKTKELITKAKIGSVIPAQAGIQEGAIKADFVVVNIHWGQEYKELSNTRQRYLAHSLIDAGADVIIGHHPHVVQEMEIYNNRPIFYSLGNFVFDQYFSVATQQGLGVGIIFTDKNISAYVFPLEQTKSQVSQMPYTKRAKYLNDWLSTSRLNSVKFKNNYLLINL
jgi:poly-gamma-glutamate synthesis protein (capsule biosynthesis protein)